MKRLTAVSALSRFPDDPRLFDTVREIHRHLHGICKKRPADAELAKEYATAFDLLKMNKKDLAYARTEFDMSDDGLRWKALAFLLQDDKTAASYLAILDKVIDDPEHPALEAVLARYAKAAAGNATPQRIDRLGRLSVNHACSASVRALADKAWQALQRDQTPQQKTGKTGKPTSATRH